MNESARPTLRLWFWAGVLLTLYKLWLVSGQAIFAIANADHDDQLFLQLAESLTRGEWLGPYDRLTLAKGPFYSCWIALAYGLGLPLFFSQHLLYAAAGATFVRACRPAITFGAALFGIYALLLWNPMSFEASSMGRVLRQHIYGSLVVLLFAGLIALYLRRHETLRRQVPWAALLGFVFGGFWLTREESIWILPSIMLLAGTSLVSTWHTSRAEGLRMTQAFGLALFCGLLPILAVCGMNYRYYRWFGTVEYRAPEFNDAYGAMLRVKVGAELPFVPVTREARAAMYAVSPAFAELRPYLDGDIGRDWAEASEFLIKRPPAEHQIGGGWLIWALRDSVSAAGHSQNAKQALKFYRRMADEINQACDDGRLPAGPRRSGFLPPWREGQTAQIAKTFVEFADFVVSFRNFNAYAPPAVGNRQELEFFSKLTREKFTPGPGTVGLPTPDADDLAKVATLQHVGRMLRRVLFVLFIIAQVLALLRVGQLLWQRRGSFPLCVAAAAWGACVANLLINALVHVTSFPVLVISSFAPIYPLVLIFIAAVFWDVSAAWIVPFLPPRTKKTKAGTPPLVAEISLHPGVQRALPWLMGLIALAPLLIWWGEFIKLFWFADDLFLLDQIDRMGFWPWITEAFAENFAPVFKLLWGGSVYLFHGSYCSMIILLWLTHAINTLCLGRLLSRTGASWFAVVTAQILFALTSANLETLGWSVQWSALLATTFFLLALLWQEKQAAQLGTWSGRVHGPLLLLVAASACSFSRGVLTGLVLALALLLPTVGTTWRDTWRARLPLVAVILLPVVAVTLIITLFSHGNHQHLSGHGSEIIQYAAGYFLLNPGYLLFDLSSWHPGVLLLLGGAKLGLIYWGLKHTNGRLRVLFILLLVYDLGNAGLLGIGRYHTGFETTISSRYNYSSLLATLPFAAVWLEHAISRLFTRSWSHRVAVSATLAGIIWLGLHHWPNELADFASWRGTDQRRLMQDPVAAQAGATVPALNYMRTERAIELIHHYNLH